jgi:ComF family protein
MHILDFIFPKRCVGCGKVGIYFCNRCVLRIRVIKPNESICPICEKLAIDGVTHPRCRTRYTIDGLTSFFRYDGVVKKGIKSVKYRFVSDLAKEFFDLVPELLLKQIPADSILIPIPLHSSRLRYRGFNQAEVLGKLFAKRLDIPMKTDIIYRSKKTVPQVEMKDRKTRLQNMDNVFTMNKQIPGRCANIILFDDVFTTGATMREAAGILKHHGVKFVWAVTMAR